MKNENTKDYNEKTLKEINESELLELLEICVKSSREKMLKGFFSKKDFSYHGITNVKLIDSILREEYNDLITETYINVMKYAEKVENENVKAYTIVFASAMKAYFKIINERLGKRIRRKVDGKRTTLGLFEQLEDEQTMKTKNDKMKNDNDYIELKIDMYNMLDIDECKIVYYIELGYTQKEIAIIQGVTQGRIAQKLSIIRKKMIDYK